MSAHFNRGQRLTALLKPFNLLIVVAVLQTRKSEVLNVMDMISVDSLMHALQLHAMQA